MAPPVQPRGSMDLYPLNEKANREVIHLGATGNGSFRWGLYLVIYMRVLAVLWLAQGLLQWRNILAPETVSIDAMASFEAATIIFFAITNLVAAVGLWLAVPWGGVLWLFAVSAQMFLIGFVGMIEGGRLILALDVALIVAYFVLSWYAAQERDAV
ncbi:MAG: hypothetical protein RIQ68_1146 [Pseudomonadota bacterium]